MFSIRVKMKEQTAYRISFFELFKCCYVRVDFSESYAENCKYFVFNNSRIFC